MNQQNQNGSAHVIIISLVTLVIVGAVGYLFWSNFAKQEQYSQTSPVSEGRTEVIEEKDLYEGWKSCEIRGMKFSIKYPKDWEFTGGETNPCNTLHPESGENGFGLISSRRDDSRYIWRIQIFTEIRKDVEKVVPGGDPKIVTMEPLDISSSAKKLYLVSSTQSGDDGKIGGFSLTDSAQGVGESIDVTNMIRDYTNELGRGYQISASMAENKNQQYVDVYSVDMFKNHPDYKNVVKIFQSLKFE